MPTSDIDYSCHIKAVQLVYLIIWITPLVIDSLGGGHTHANTHIHTYTYTHIHIQTSAQKQY